MPVVLTCRCGNKLRLRDPPRNGSLTCPACGTAVHVAPAPSPLPKVDAPQLEIDRLFHLAIQHGASNLHIKVGRPPTLRISGVLRQLGHTSLTEDQVIKLCIPLLDERHAQAYHRDGGTDLAHIVHHEGVRWRFRINLFRQLGTMAMIAQGVAPHIPDMESLHLPPTIEQLCQFDQGMILLAGMTGSGKTTTIASMLNWINHNYFKHILTIEDPIEYVFDDDKCLVNQREIGENVKNFAIAMKHAVREDPDVILVGDMRDQESFSTALHAAETGHLVFGTIHAPSASATIGRILDLFPIEMHHALRSTIVFNVRAIVAQRLLPTIRDEPKQVPIVEIMTFTPTIRKLVLEEKDEKLSAAIRLGRQEGMQEFDDSLYDFVTRGYISRAAAIQAAPNSEGFKMKLKGVDVRARGMI